MANIQERRDKAGKLISYSIRVHRGRGADGKQLKPWTATFEVEPTWTEKSARKKAEAYAANFERDCRNGITTDSRQKFQEYAEYVLSLKEGRGKTKSSTTERYRELTIRIYPEIGHIKLKDLRAVHLNTLYDKLGKEGVRKGGGNATAKLDLAAMMKEKHITKASVATRSKLAPSTVAAAVTGQSVSIPTAKKVAEALGLKLEKSFEVSKGGDKLADKTILEYHRLISSILAQAEKEGLVPFNVASKATPPTPKKKEPNYFQPETVYAILDAADKEPLKYRAFVYLCVVTGARCGELAGLKWNKVDLETGQITIDEALIYSPKRGVYQESTKTEDHRSMKIPMEVVGILKQLRREQNEARLKCGSYWTDTGYIFTRDNGQPMNPQTWTGWMDDFSERHGLPHINPHAFRHTAASVLIANHTDVVTVSKMLGHADPTTTAKIYSHMIVDAKAAASDTITDVLLRKRA